MSLANISKQYLRDQGRQKKSGARRAESAVLLAQLERTGGPELFRGVLNAPVATPSVSAGGDGPGLAVSVRH